ncbi:unnamed protein product, partial [Dibothriocephalus latus]
MSEKEGEYDRLEPVAAEATKVMQQISETEVWSTSVLPSQEKLEGLNWAAGQLLTAAGILEVTLSLFKHFKDEIGKSPFEGDSESARQMLASANRRWDGLIEAINHRRHRLQTVLMSLGEFDTALDSLIQWIQVTQASVDSIPVSRGDTRSLEFELARTKVVQASVAKRQIDVARLNQEAKRLGLDEPSSVGTDTSLDQVNEKRIPRLRQLNSSWEGLKRSVKEKNLQLEEAIREAQKFYSQLDELRRDCHVLEGHIPTSGTRVMGGLPDSAKQKLGQFMRAYNAIENLGNQVDELRCSSAGLLASAEPTGTRKRLSTQLDRLGNRQADLQ